MAAGRKLFRPKYPEGEQCASCPFRAGNDAEFAAIIKRLRTTNGETGKVTPGLIASARAKIRRDVSMRGDFICHASIYGPGMALNEPSAFRQCPGATRAFRGEESSEPMPNVEEKFTKIMEEALTKAEAVKCPFPDFVEGLKTMRETLNDRIASAETEAGGQ